MSHANPVVALSPYHSIELAEALWPILEKPARKDYVIRTISVKKVQGMPLIQGDLVIAGLDALDQFPQASRYPVHFRKTHFPMCLHADPEHEFRNLLRASQIIQTPPPIGADKRTFRSCFIPGKPLSKITPFKVDPPQNNVAIGERTDTATLIGLWHLLSLAHDQVEALHRNGLSHNDLFLHNAIVSLAPIGVFLIDFEKATERAPDEVESNGHNPLQSNDFDEIFRQAIYLQCVLGAQHDPLGNASRDAIDSLFDKPDFFRKRIHDQNPVADSHPIPQP